MHTHLRIKHVATEGQFGLFNITHIGNSTSSQRHSSHFTAAPL